MDKLFYANVDVWNNDAGSIYIGAESLEEADKILEAYEQENWQDNVTYIGRISELQTPYYKDPCGQTFDILGNVEGLFCGPGEDWISIQFHKESCEQKTHFASIDTFLDREMPFLGGGHND